MKHSTSELIESSNIPTYTWYNERGQQKWLPTPFCYCSVTKLWPTLRPHRLQHASLSYLYLPEFAQTHVHWVGENIQPSNHLILCCPPSPPALNLPQHQGLFQGLGSLHQVANHVGLSYRQIQIGAHLSQALVCPNRPYVIFNYGKYLNFTTCNTYEAAKKFSFSS